MRSMMSRSTQLRFAAIAVFAAAALALTMASARAFSQADTGAGGDGNSAFADPDEQVNIFGVDQGPQPSGMNGPVQSGTQQGQTNPFSHFQSNGLALPPPNPLSRPSN